MNEAFLAWTNLLGVSSLGFSNLYTIYAIMILHALFAAIFDRFFP